MTTTFRCRMTVPKETAWTDVQADSFEEAANDFHIRLGDGIRFQLYENETPDGQRMTIYFACIEVEGHEEVVSRFYHHAIYRRGGVRPRLGTLKERLEVLAKQLGWTHDPAQLIEPDWEGEETIEEAVERRETSRS